MLINERKIRAIMRKDIANLKKSAITAREFTKRAAEQLLILLKKNGLKTASHSYLARGRGGDPLLQYYITVARLA